MAKSDVYPISRMDDCLDSIGNLQIFTALDSDGGYWQVPMGEKANALSPFETH